MNKIYLRARSSLTFCKKYNTIKKWDWSVSIIRHDPSGGRSQYTSSFCFSRNHY
jgi:hypothetical protein